MIAKIKDFFNSAARSGEEPEPGLKERRIQIAACALLIEMASIDSEFSEEERARILSILKKEFVLSDDMADELIALSMLELKASIDIWQFANLINDNYTPAEKIRLMEMVWKVVYADGRLDKHEDYLIRKLTKLLNLRHREMIEAKLNVMGKR